MRVHSSACLNVTDIHVFSNVINIIMAGPCADDQWARTCSIVEEALRPMSPPILFTRASGLSSNDEKG